MQTLEKVGYFLAYAVIHVVAIYLFVRALMWVGFGVNASVIIALTGWMIYSFTLPRHRDVTSTNTSAKSNV